MSSKIEQLVHELGIHPQNGAFDLSALLRKWEKEFPLMDKEEAFIRLLFEIGRE